MRALESLAKKATCSGRTAQSDFREGEEEFALVLSVKDEEALAVPV